MLRQQMIHVFAPHIPHMLTIQQLWLSWGEFHNEKAAFRVSNIHKDHCSISIFDLIYMCVSILSSQTYPIIQE